MPEFFVGKTVEVLIPDRDNYGKVIPNTFTKIIGECTFCGRNEHLDIPLQAIVNRTPIELRSLSDIKVVAPKIVFD
ncbi:MAG: hypothetical protein ACOCVF_02310 [bacterium]